MLAVFSLEELRLIITGLFTQLIGVDNTAEATEAWTNVDQSSLDNPGRVIERMDTVFR